MQSLSSASCLRTISFGPSAPSRYFSQKIQPADTVVKNDLQTISRDLVGAIEEEKKESIQVMEEQELQDFLKNAGFELEIKDESVILRKIAKNFSITLSFPLPEDEFNEQDVESKEENEDDEERGENEEEGETETQGQLEKSVELELIIENSVGEKVQKLQAECAVGKDRNFYLENIRFGEGKRLWFSDLNSSLQEKLYEWLDGFGLDSNLANFVLEYRSGFKSQIAMNALDDFKSFLGVKPVKKTSSTKPKQ